MATIQSSDLDFTTLKNNLKTYLQRSSEFQDYDFDASGLSNILDVLAYNTHINGLVANLGINESFLNSAQLRSSAVSHAETLGYRPHSKTASKATVTLSASTGSGATPSATLPQYTTFTSTVNGESYTFRTLEQYTATNDGSGNFTFKTTDGLSNISITEGTLKTKTFIIGDTNDEQVFIIPDVNLDTTTLDVKVYDTVTSSSFTQYSNIEDIVRISSDSTIFIVRESPNGFFEITFGEGNVLGASPQAGNKVEVTYITSAAADANDATTFIADDDVNIAGTDYTLTVTTVSNSAGGAEKESIASIKANAPIAFATQQRLVTAEDYKALILQRYSTTVQDVTSWGGNDNIPAIYGRVYVSINFKTGISSAVQTSVKDSIVNQLSENLAIMSIDTVFVDPIDTFIELTTDFNLDPNLTGDTSETVANTIKSEISSFFTTNLSTFDAVFRRSSLLATIDDLSPAILDSAITTKIQQRFVPTLSYLTNYDVNMPVALAQPDDVNYIINTSAFTISSGETVFARNRLESTTIELVDENSGLVIIDNAGSYNQTTGVISFVGVNITAYSGSYIRVTATPANQGTIRPLRNYILNVDLNRTSVIANLDFQNTEASLST